MPAGEIETRTWDQEHARLLQQQEREAEFRRKEQEAELRRMERETEVWQKKREAEFGQFLQAAARSRAHRVAEVACWAMAAVTLAGCAVVLFSSLVAGERAASREHADNPGEAVDLNKKLQEASMSAWIENQRGVVAAERRAATTQACVALTGIAILFTAFALLLGGSRMAAGSAGGPWGGRLVPFVPGVVALLCATVILAVVSSDGRSGTGKTPATLPIGVPAVGFGAPPVGFG